MNTLPRLPEHPLEHFCRADQADPVLGRTCEEILIGIYEQNPDETVREVVNVALYDLQAAMLSLFQLLEQLDAMPNSPVVLIAPPPVKYDA